jgi:hypothetical protein
MSTRDPFVLSADGQMNTALASAGLQMLAPIEAYDGAPADRAGRTAHRFRAAGG